MRHCVVPWFVWHCWLSSSLASLVSLLHAGVPTIVNSAMSLLVLRYRLSLGEACSERLHSCSCFLFFFFDLALFLVVSGHASTQTCAQGSTGLHVWWSLSALSRASRTSGITFSAAAHDCFASHCAFISRDGSAVHLWTDVRVFLHFGLSFLPLRYGLIVHFGLLLAGLPAQDSDHLSYDQRSSLSR